MDPELEFIESETTLAYATVETTTTLDPTITDPDQATTTQTPAPATETEVVALPPGIPSRIYPVRQLAEDTNLDGFSLISILYTEALNWPFVVTNGISASQIFGYTKMLIATALEIPSEQVLTYALQAHVPLTYKSPADAHLLGTIYLGYIPTELVEDLVNQIKAKNSRFYTAASDPRALDLAKFVNTGFSLTAIADPKQDGSNGGGGGLVSSTGATSNSKSRQDVIIGVVSALGAIAVFVLVFLVYRSLKKRRELAHRRLSDPPDMAGYRPEGREFDQDSVGGQRRRSFYFAEDSLRGFGEQRQEPMTYDHRTDPQHQGIAQMRSRHVGPTAISAPILRESSMNW